MNRRTAKILVLFGAIFFSHSIFASLSLFVEPEGPQRIVKIIGDAKKSIAVELYMLTNNDIENALIAAYKRGVDVKIILEQNPYGGFSNLPAINVLSAGGIPLQNIHWSNPMFVLTHEKAMVIDPSTPNAKALIMTLNLSNSAFLANREYGIIDTNNADIREIMQIFTYDWHAGKITPLAHNLRLVWSPINSRLKIVRLISSAQKSLFIEGEELMDSQIESLIHYKIAQGVEVKIILPVAEKPYFYSSSSIRYLDPDQGQLYMHAKMIIADNNRAYIGSENFSTPSLDSNRELGIIFQDANLITTLIKTFNSDWQNAKP